MNTQQKEEDAGAIDRAHEYDLKLFAFLIAVLDKTASLIGLLAFVWATTVLLGGFAGSLEGTDFMLVTLILVVEGARICCRSQEMEWRQQTAENHLWPLLRRGGTKLFSWYEGHRLVIPLYRHSDSSHIADVPDVEAQVQSDSSKRVPDVEPQVQSDSSQRDDPSDVKAPAFSYSIPRTVEIINELLLGLQSSSAITYIVPSLRRQGTKLFSLCRRKLRSVNPFYRQSDSSHIADVPDVEAQVQSDSSKRDDVPDVEPQVQSDSNQRDDPSDVKAPAFSYSIPRTVGIIIELLLWLQSLSAIAYIVLSLMRLIKNDFGDEESKEARNRNAALKIFYGLVFSEGFVLARALYLIRNSDKLINRVCRKWDIGNSGMAPVRRFFYEAHSSCINGSIFDAMKKDLVFFAMQLLGSDSTEEQRMGALLLEKFVMNGRLANGTLQKIGTVGGKSCTQQRESEWRRPLSLKWRRPLSLKLVGGMAVE